MKVYDCFLFFNELDLLELRLETLGPVVDRFVLVEGPQTFSGKPKSQHFLEARKRFRPWLKKIRRVEVPPMAARDAWQREYMARSAMARGFSDAAPDDWIFQSDCDEIWRPELRDTLPEAPLVTYEMFHCYYFLNTPRIPHHDWHGTRRIKRRSWITGQALRASTGKVIKNGGWHFSFLGDEYAASEKLKAFSHTEYSGAEYHDPERIRRHIGSGTDIINPAARYLPVPVDDTFPKPVLESPERWARYIRAA